MLNISVNYKAKNSWIVHQNDSVTEGSVFNVTLVSADGRPNVTELLCWVGGSQLAASDANESTANKSPTSHERADKQLHMIASREHNGRALSCKFEQDKVLTEWKNQTLVVFYKANINLTDYSFNGTHLEGNVRLGDGNPEPTAQCFANGNDSLIVSSASNINASNGSILTGNKPHSVSYTTAEQIESIEITCNVIQNGSINFSEWHNWTINSTTSMPTTEPPRQVEHQPSPIVLKLVPMLLIAVLLPLILIPVLKRRRGAATAAIQISAERKSDGKKSDEPRLSMEQEQEFMKTHYLYPNLSSMEYATVVGSAPGLTDSSETIYLPIIGHLDQDGNLVVAT